MESNPSEKKTNKNFIAILIVGLILMAVLFAQSLNNQEQGQENVQSTESQALLEVESTESSALIFDQDVVLRLADDSFAAGPDPLTAVEDGTISLVGNLFLQLLRFDANSEVYVPEIASSWIINEDASVYTFTLREDIPWVRHSSQGQLVEQVLGEEDAPRFVSAGDFVTAFTRLCLEEGNNQYTQRIKALIVGCAEAELQANSELGPGEQPTLVDGENFGVRAIDSSTLEINLNQAAGYFLSMVSMWYSSPIPQWLYEEIGAEWVSAENIVYNGNFTINDWNDEEINILRNPLLPQDLQGRGNVRQIELSFLGEINVQYALWLAGVLDESMIPEDFLDIHFELYDDEVFQQSDFAVFYFAFANDKEPFDDPALRAAFSAALDRQSFVINELQYQGQAMIHLAPPSIFGAAQIDAVGVGFDADFARQHLAEAGYADCENLPPVQVLGFSGLYALKWLEFAVNSWTEVLGCESDLFTIEQVTLAELLERVANEGEEDERPHIWTFGWIPEFGDQENWLGHLLSCESDAQNLGRECSNLDDQLLEAREKSDQEARKDLYAQIEEGFFGEDGEFPIAPVFLRAQTLASHSWLLRPNAILGGDQWWQWTIDLGAREAYLE